METMNRCLEAILELTRADEPKLRAKLKVTAAMGLLCGHQHHVRSSSSSLKMPRDPNQDWTGSTVASGVFPWGNICSSQMQKQSVSAPERPGGGGGERRVPSYSTVCVQSKSESCNNFYRTTTASSCAGCYGKITEVCFVSGCL